MAFSEKQKALLKSKARVEFAEGTTASGKSYTLRQKMLFRCIYSKYEKHVILGYSKGKIEDNLLGNPNSPDSFLYQFQTKDKILEYYPSGHGKISDPHILLHCRDKAGKRTDKIIYIWGAGDISAISKIRGGVYGCIYVDELNMINEEVAREACARSNDWFCGSLNPDNPDKSIYELVNKSRPLPEFTDDIPREMLALLNEPAEDGWIYWHFNFNDNPIMTPEKIAHKKSSFTEGTQGYNSLILGLRTKSEGLVFDCFSKENVIEEEEIVKQIKERQIEWDCFTCGVDTSFSSNTPDTNSVIFSGIDTQGRIFVLEEYVINNKDLSEDNRIYASDLCEIIDNKLKQWCKKWGYLSNFYIDCADVNTLGEYKKFRRNIGSDFVPVACDKTTFPIKARNDKVNEWLQTKCLYINKKCTNVLFEINAYSYDPDTGKVLDKNNHTIDAFNYSWTKFYKKIGINSKEVN